MSTIMIPRLRKTKTNSWTFIFSVVFYFDITCFSFFTCSSLSHVIFRGFLLSLHPPLSLSLSLSLSVRLSLSIYLHISPLPLRLSCPRSISLSTNFLSLSLSLSLSLLFSPTPSIILVPLHSYMSKVNDITNIVFPETSFDKMFKH